MTYGEFDGPLICLTITSISAVILYMFNDRIVRILDRFGEELDSHFKKEDRKGEDLWLK